MSTNSPAMKNTLSRRRALTLATGSLASPLLAAGVARAADDWPNKPVRYINSFPAGGPTDVLSRIACQKLGELTGQQFVVENRADRAAMSAPRRSPVQHPTATRSVSIASPAT